MFHVSIRARIAIYGYVNICFAVYKILSILILTKLSAKADHHGFVDIHRCATSEDTLYGRTQLLQKVKH